MFSNVYQQWFPSGDSSLFAGFMFDAFDENRVCVVANIVLVFLCHIFIICSFHWITFICILHYGLLMRREMFSLPYLTTRGRRVFLPGTDACCRCHSVLMIQLLKHLRCVIAAQENDTVWQFCLCFRLSWRNVPKAVGVFERCLICVHVEWIFH